ncbi:uncharacterized protein LY89DRAFT_412240 [Mollisia scopiformis]|uniref:Ubiquitin-like domain-containing protein n=1 Tax=Mollisia scopiformis TaxID=149040 RepID=A0A132B200_MOLSC|nr:uncharacterized protein LY89DRAFT_412240 [Mollisia scopiformis]KUJ06415.1 hypothetical protein LY89DRAFT_412240 [Mollisia scopiformis]
MAVPGYSLNDLIQGINFVVDALSALKEDGGASSEYQQTIQEMNSLEQILRSIQRITPTETNTSYFRLIHTQASELEATIRCFVSSTEKYNEALGHRSKRRDGVLRKLQWHFVESSTVKALKSKLSFHLQIIDMLWQLLQFDYLATYEVSRKVDHDMLSSNSTQLLSICNKIHTSQISSNSLLHNQNATAALTSATFIEKLDEQIRLSKDILNALAGLENTSVEVSKADRSRCNLDTETNPTASFHVNQTRISLEHLGVIANKSFLELCNILDMQVELRNEIKCLAEKVESLAEKVECNEERGTSLRAMSSNLMNQAGLLGQEIFRRLYRMTCNVTKNTCHQVGLLSAMNPLNAIGVVNPWSTALFINLKLAIPRSPFSISRADSIHFLDATGTSRLLPYIDFQHYRTFVTMLEETYRNTPTGRYVFRRRYYLVGTGSKDGEIITKDTWSNHVHPGIGIAMNIILSHAKFNRAECPKCKSVKTHIEDEGPYGCTSCGLIVYSRNAESRPKRDLCEDQSSNLHSSQQKRPLKYHRFYQDLAVLGFGPDRYEDEMLEERDIKYFKRLSIRFASDEHKPNLEQAYLTTRLLYIASGLPAKQMALEMCGTWSFISTTNTLQSIPAIRHVDGWTVRARKFQ